MNQDSQPSGFDLRSAANCSAFVCQTLAASVEVFLHKRFGRRYLGFQALAVLVAIPLYSLAWPAPDAEPLSLFFWAYVVALVLAKTEIVRRELRGDAEHSYYSGTPVIMPVFRRLDEATVKRVWEPALVVLVGAALLPTTQALGMYLMLAGASLGISEGLKYTVTRSRVADMNDAMIEQQNLMGRFRGMRGRR